MNRVSKNKILIADDTSSIRDEIKKTLNDHYDVIEASNGLQVISLVHANPDIACIIMDITMPHLNGLKTTYLLKASFTTYHIPIIMLTNQIALADMIHAVEMGADDYIKKPCDPAELNARLLMNIRRSQRDQHANPLTKLPGNTMINRIITQRLEQPLAILYADLDNFKAYNDNYGFKKGDEIIEHTASLLTQALHNHGNPDDFLGHIGGDDFVLVSTPDKAEKIAQEICTRFDQNALQFYNTHDQEQKKIAGHDRQGNVQEFPLVSISVAIITNEKKELTSMPQIAQQAAEMKHYAKSKPGGIVGSNFVKEKRS